MRMFECGFCSAVKLRQALANVTGGNPNDGVVARVVSRVAPEQKDAPSAFLQQIHVANDRFFNDEFEKFTTSRAAGISDNPGHELRLKDKKASRREWPRFVPPGVRECRQNSGPQSEGLSQGADRRWDPRS
jgi:hypothetical protein